MPQQADIVVKKADGSTNVTYVKVQPASGDNSPAIWKEPTTGTVRAGQPDFQVRSRKNGQQKARRVDGAFLYPKVRFDTNGNATVNGGLNVNWSCLVPQDMTDGEISEGVHQAFNLAASAAVKEMCTTGYAAT